MKKLLVLGVLLAMSTGCGRGWFPHLFRGAPCNGLCSAPAPTLHHDCDNCGTVAGYEGYESGEVIGTGPQYVDSIPGQMAPIQGNSNPPIVMPGK